MKRLEASVNPLPNGRALWRLRELNSDEGSPAEDAQRMFLEDAPIGFFVARADGGVDYMNPALRAVLGLGDEPARLKVKDFVRDDANRVLRRDRRGFGAARTRITLKARDGQETNASAVTFWPADPDDDSARILIFFQETETGEGGALELGHRAVVASTHSDGVFASAPFGAGGSRRRRSGRRDLARFQSGVDGNDARQSLARRRVRPNCSMRPTVPQLWASACARR